MGRKAKSRRVTMQRRKRMSAVKGKFREEKKERMRDTTGRRNEMRSFY